jgi:hypothetical protein
MVSKVVVPKRAMAIPCAVMAVLLMHVLLLCGETVVG